MIIVRFVNVTMSGNSRRFIVEFNNKLENAKNPFIEEGNERFKMVKRRGWGEVGPLPTIDGFTDYSSNIEINLFWYDTAKRLSSVKKHIYDILTGYIHYSDEIAKKAVEEAEIEQFPKWFSVKIQMNLK